MQVGSKSRCHRVGFARARYALLLLGVAAGTHAQSVFKCTDARGGVAFQATACAAALRQTAVQVHAQALIDPDAAAVAPAMAHPGNHPSRNDSSRQGHTLAHASTHRSARTKGPSSYECRASDGEVFYRHTRCPHSVPGDGVARFGFEPANATSHHGRRGSHGSAWSAVPVTARKITRGQACRQIDATAAGSRDGHARDERVSVYEHLLGRDPCRGL